MKTRKLILAATVLLLIMGCQKKVATPEIAQGYGAVKFGASVETVRQAYAIGEEVELATNNNDGNLTTLTQREVSENITMRRFRFNEGKLYEVAVYYPRKIDFDQILNTLKEKYGPIDDRTINGNGNDFGSGYVFQKYLPKLQVWATNYTEYAHEVTYTWREFVDSYDLSKTGLIEL
jgi:hypothetical protein